MVRTSSGAGVLGSSIQTGEIDNQAVTMPKLQRGTNGQLIVGATNADPAYQTVSGDATLSSAGVLALKTFTGALTVGNTTKFSALAGTDVPTEDGTWTTNANVTITTVRNANNFRVRAVGGVGAPASFRAAGYWNLSAASSRVYMRVPLANSAAGAGDFMLYMFSSASPTNDNDCYLIQIVTSNAASDVLLRKVVGGAFTTLATESVDITATDTQYCEFMFDGTLGMLMLNRAGSPAGATFPTLLAKDTAMATIAAVGIGIGAQAGWGNGSDVATQCFMPMTVLNA